jgi:hypothetical protein
VTRRREADLRHHRQAGSREHVEYWIVPVGDLTAFNSEVIAKIGVIAGFR